MDLPCYRQLTQTDTNHPKTGAGSMLKGHKLPQWQYCEDMQNIIPCILLQTYDFQGLFYNFAILRQMLGLIPGQ